MNEVLNEEFDETYSLLGEEEIRDGQKRIVFKGIFSEADKLNRNHRIYPKAVLKEAFDNAMTESQKTGQPIIGELEHAPDSKIRLERIAVTFPELKWEDGKIVGTAVPTLTEAGKTVEGLAKSGLKICFSTRCAGRVKPYHGNLAEGVNNAVEVLPGLKIISIDVVASPSCQAAVSQTVKEENTLSESASGKTLKDLLDENF